MSELTSFSFFQQSRTNMLYSSCYEEFTEDQITRMTNMWNTYRA